ncbi:MAG: FKBP-type peptidyl-prolyl cis-trans isomerase, partial [Terriglobales bacterium]
LIAMLLAALSLSAGDKAKKPGPPPVPGTPFTRPDGLKIWEIKTGTGARAIGGMDLTVNYTGWLLNGKKFDSSADNDGPFTFRLGSGHVIKGWEEGLVGMRAGGKRRLQIPPDLAYGMGGKGDIPPNATLVFDIELLAVN